MIMKPKNKSLKAQFWSLDVIFAIVIFTVALTILVFTWNNVDTQLSSAYGSESGLMQTEAATLAQSILSSGYPNNWASVVNTTNSSTWSNVSVGLAPIGGSTDISTSKLYAFMAMSNYNYQDLKQSLGVGYDYYIIISNNAVNITIGENPITNGAYTVYSYKESARLNGVPVGVDVILWTPQPISV